MPKRRPAPEISLSFLDVICCGFGAVILLLMITKTVEPQVLEESTVIAEGRVAELTEQLFEIRGETTVLNRDLAAKQEQISEFEEQIDFCWIQHHVSTFCVSIVSLMLCLLQIAGCRKRKRSFIKNG